MMSKIHEYVRDNQGHKIGCFIAELKETGLMCGWSKMRQMDIDAKRPFDRDLALKIAQGRLDKKSTILKKCIKDEYCMFMVRAEKYFKREVISPVLVDLAPYRELYDKEREKSDSVA
jgi:hypothetical protein